MLLGGSGDCDDDPFRRHPIRQGRHRQSLWGLPPALDMDYEKRVQEAIREIVDEGLAESAHDLSDGGLAVALAECCVRQRRSARRSISIAICGRNSCCSTKRRRAS